MIGARARTWNAVALSTLVAGLCGCGAAYETRAPSGEPHLPHEPETCTDNTVLPNCEQRLHALEARLVGALPDIGELVRPDGQSVSAAPPREMPPLEQDQAPQQGPDCTAAADLRDRICELADAICALAARPNAASSTQASCDSGRNSCRRARDDVARACATDAAP